MGEVVEGYLDTAKKLVSRWSDYGTWVATRLDDGTYDADSAVGDLAGAVQLTLESGARLAWEAVDAWTILGGRLGPHIVDSGEFSIDLPAAEVRLEADLRSPFADILPASMVLIIPVELSPGKTKFKLRAIATGCRAGTYIGLIAGSLPEHKRAVWIIVP